MSRLYLLLLIFLANSALGHGGVVEEEDLCVIKVNYLRGHFKIYQPLIDGHEEYCEDLPNATESIFVMEYLHDSLREATVDFRGMIKVPLVGEVRATGRTPNELGEYLTKVAFRETRGYLAKVLTSRNHYADLYGPQGREPIRSSQLAE